MIEPNVKRALVALSEDNQRRATHEREFTLFFSEADAGGNMDCHVVAGGHQGVVVANEEVIEVIERGAYENALSALSYARSAFAASVNGEEVLHCDFEEEIYKRLRGLK